MTQEIKRNNKEDLLSLENMQLLLEKDIETYNQKFNIQNEEINDRK